MKRGSLVVLVGCLAVVFACGGESSNGDGTGGRGNSSATGGVTGGDDPAELCRIGCEATLAADCENGPATQQQCEDDCAEFDVSACSGEYRTLVACSAGKSVVCIGGIPIVRGCETQQAEFASCLQGG
jgi:hypothetical protein